jgi:hypothetical protein
VCNDNVKGKGRRARENGQCKRRFCFFTRVYIYIYIYEVQCSTTIIVLRRTTNRAGSCRLAERPKEWRKNKGLIAGVMLAISSVSCFVFYESV